MRHGAIEPSLEYLADRGNRVIPAMSAFGTCATCRDEAFRSGFGGKADIDQCRRFWMSLAEPIDEARGSHAIVEPTDPPRDEAGW